MTRLRQIAMAGLAAVAIGGVANSAQASETGTFENRLNGATIGLPLGALPPPGLYTGLTTAYLGMLSGSSTTGASTGNQCAAVGPPGSGKCAVLPAIAQAVPLLWVPGWSWWGATYSASVVEAFYLYSTCGGNTFSEGPHGAAVEHFGNGGCGTGNPITGGGMVYTNLFVQPINLSWKLGGGWFIGTAFAFTAPTGTKAGGGFTPNPDYWTFEPSIAFSYLGQSWVASANFFYDINARSQGSCCAAEPITSGNLFYGDFSALYKIGKWSIGPVGYTEIQTTADTGTCTPAPGVSLCGRHETAAAGALVGYDFGPVDLQVWVTDNFIGRDSPDGPGALHVWSRIGFKIWGFEAPPVAPMASK